MESAHLPTTAKAGLCTQGLTADRGHAESVKQTAPSPLASEVTTGTTTSTTRSATRTAAMTARRGFALVMGWQAYSRCRWMARARASRSLGYSRNVGTLLRSSATAATAFTVAPLGNQSDIHATVSDTLAKKDTGVLRFAKTRAIPESTLRVTAALKPVPSIVHPTHFKRLPWEASISTDARRRASFGGVAVASMMHRNPAPPGWRSTTSAKAERCRSNDAGVTAPRHMHTHMDMNSPTASASSLWMIRRGPLYLRWLRLSLGAKRRGRGRRMAHEGASETPTVEWNLPSSPDTFSDGHDLTSPALPPVGQPARSLAVRPGAPPPSP